jgi:SAM-dependent methyltransferase
MNNITHNRLCLACGGSDLLPIFDLGMQPLANSYLTNKDDIEEKYPLGVNLCNHCYHLQLTDTVDPKIIYKNYLYVSGTSSTLKNYSDWFAGYVDEHCTILTKRILDIGCNDGTQLDSFKSLGYQTYGIDPAENIYAISSAKHKVICDFFGPKVVDKVNYTFDAITAQNVFAHNPNPLEFLQSCKKLMSEHTLLFIQTSQADMVLNNEFDTIYHEHINFFNINSMNELAKRADLYLIDAIKTPIHGNSYIFVLGRNGKPFNISNKINMEGSLLNTNTYKSWEKNVKENMVELKRRILFYQNQGYKVVGYGAAAKGNTLLNYIDTKLDLIIDDNSLKQNLYVPGTKVFIKGPNTIAEFSIDDKIVFMPLAWNFFTEISKKIKNIRDMKQDVFLKYFPKVEIINV